MKYILSSIGRILFILALLLLLPQINKIVQGEVNDFFNNSSVVSGLLISVILIIVAIQFFTLIISVLAHQLNPSSLILELHALGISGVIRKLYRVHFSPNGRMNFLFLFWGVFIGVFIVIFIRNDVFGGKEDFFLHIKYFNDLFERTSGVDTTVTVLPLFTDDNNAGKYLENILKISKDLKMAGAKVVIAEIPFMTAPGGFLQTKKLNRLREQLDSLKIFIFAEQPEVVSVRSLRFRTLPGKHFVYSTYQYSNPFRSYRTNSFNNVQRWSPYQEWRTENIFGLNESRYDKNTQIDVALLIAKKFLNMPDSIQPVRRGSEIHLQDIRIPVTREGVAYSANSTFFARFPALSAYRGISSHGWIDTVDVMNDMLVYQDVNQPSAPYFNSLEADKNLSRFEDVFRDKIVIIDWFYPDVQHSFIDIIPICGVIANTIRQKFYTNLQDVQLALSLCAIFCIGIIVKRYTFFISIVITVLLLFMITSVSIWLFFSQMIIIEFLYTILAIITAFIIFSVLKLSPESVHTS